MKTPGTKVEALAPQMPQEIKPLLITKKHWTDYLQSAQQGDPVAQFASANEVLSLLRNRGLVDLPASAQDMGKELVENGFMKAQKRINGKPQYGYYFKRSNECSSSHSLETTIVVVSVVLNKTMHYLITLSFSYYIVAGTIKNVLLF